MYQNVNSFVKIFTYFLQISNAVSFRAYNFVIYYKLNFETQKDRRFLTVQACARFGFLSLNYVQNYTSYKKRSLRMKRPLFSFLILSCQIGITPSLLYLSTIAPSLKKYTFISPSSEANTTIISMFISVIDGFFACISVILGVS